MPHDPGRKAVTLQLTQEQRIMFKNCKEALSNTSYEETFKLMLDLMYLAISITGKDNDMVTLYTRDPSKVVNSIVKCPHCEKELQPNARLQDDGYREVAIKLIANKLAQK